jgi:predicted PurR-regulated permease PerM
MSKKVLVTVLLVALVLTLVAPVAALAQEGDPELESLFEQIQELRVKIVERQVELGNLTQEEGDSIISRIQERFQLMLEKGFGGGYGMFGRFGEGGSGRGFGHCWR